MAKQKRQQRITRVESPAESAEQPAPRKTRAPKKARHGAATNGSPNGNGSGLIELPRRGPGRRKMVHADSLDGIAIQLANELAGELAAEIAPRIVGKVRGIAERYVRAQLDAALAKLG